MKTVGRQSVCLHSVIASQEMPPPISLRTAYVFRSEDNRYIHAMSAHPSQDAAALVRLSSCDWDYEISVRCTQDTRLIAYTRVNGQLQWAVDTDDHYVKVCLQRGNTYMLCSRLKSLVLVTHQECSLRVRIRCIPAASLYESVRRVSHLGHIVLQGDDSMIRERSERYSLSPTAHQQLHARPSMPPLPANVRGMQYSVTLSSLITVSASVDQQYRCPPYSIALAKITGYRAYLSYDISLRPSARDAASITLTAVESLSSESYSILQDEDGKDITRQHQGQRVTGELRLPLLCPDVGIHIYTHPYGFSVDVGEDPNTAIATFHTLRVRYDTQ